MQPSGLFLEVLYVAIFKCLDLSCIAEEYQSTVS